MTVWFFQLQTKTWVRRTERVFIQSLRLRLQNPSQCSLSLQILQCRKISFRDNQLRAKQLHRKARTKYVTNFKIRIYPSKEIETIKLYPFYGQERTFRNSIRLLDCLKQKWEDQAKLSREKTCKRCSQPHLSKSELKFTKFSEHDMKSIFPSFSGRSVRSSLGQIRSTFCALSIEGFSSQLSNKKKLNLKPLCSLENNFARLEKMQVCLKMS